LQAIHNPLDEIALLRVVNFPARGVGHETIHRLQAASLADKRPLAAVMAAAAEVPGVGERRRAPSESSSSFSAYARAVPSRHIGRANEELVRSSAWRRCATR